MSARTLILRAELAAARQIRRDIEIVGQRSLYVLAQAIVGAFGFDFDHAFGFFPSSSRNFYNAKPRYELFADMGEASEGSLSVKRTPVEAVFTRAGRTMLFLFDYGDEWLFQVTLLGHGEASGPRAKPRVVASAGEAPPQYPDFDDEDEGEDA